MKVKEVPPVKKVHQLFEPNVQFVRCRCQSSGLGRHALDDLHLPGDVRDRADHRSARSSRWSKSSDGGEEALMKTRPVEARLDNEAGEIRFYDENGQRVGRVHPRRWRFIAIVDRCVHHPGVLLHQAEPRCDSAGSSQTKASVQSLERTNCALRQFLFSAYTARHRQALDDVSPHSTQD
jgi:hypothetical protein